MIKPHYDVAKVQFYSKSSKCFSIYLKRNQFDSDRDLKDKKSDKDINANVNPNANVLSPLIRGGSKAGIYLTEHEDL